MLKSEAVARWGSDTVEEARDYYETDFGKYLFQEDCPEDEWCASDEDQIERCTRASRNRKIEGPIDQTMGEDKRYGMDRVERFETRRSVTHEYMYSMPVAAYREKRRDLTAEELEFLRGNPGWQYSEHWSTPSQRYSHRLFSEHEVDLLLEDLTNQVLYIRELINEDSITATDGMNQIFERLLALRS